MTITAPSACLEAAKAAAKGRLTDEQINEALHKVAQTRARLVAEGKVDNLAERLRTEMTRQAEEAKAAAALLKRNAGLKILAFERLSRAVDTLTAQGMKPHQALLALMEGTKAAVKGGPVSVFAARSAYETRYSGAMLAELEHTLPHVRALLRDRAFNEAIIREMMELREGGTAGITGNRDAQAVARLYATYAEMSRQELNRLGASIDTLDGWAGAQTHDELKMLAAGKAQWVETILPLLDTERSLPESKTAKAVRQALGSLFDAITTGTCGTPARSPVKFSVLYFKDADAVITYGNSFGYSTLADAMIAQQKKAADLAAHMQTFGPEPENMLQSLIIRLERALDASPLPPAEKTALHRQLHLAGARIRHGMDSMTGLVTRSATMNAAKIADEVRAVQAMAELGDSTLAAAGDGLAASIALQFHGSRFREGLASRLDGIFSSRSDEEKKEIALLIGEGFAALCGQINAGADGYDIPLGVVAKQQERLLKWSGQAWWETKIRCTAARVIAFEMAMRAKSAFADLPPLYRHVLTLHGIDAADWEAVRRADAFVAQDGHSYLTSERMRLLRDEDVAHAIATTEENGQGAGQYDRVRLALEMKLRAFVADETLYSMLSTEARAQRRATHGYRPGTLAGETMRFILQFKSLPAAFTDRSPARASYGFGRRTSQWEQSAHIGTLIVGLGVTGYMAMTAKEIAQGAWPPRDPADPQTVEAALRQGGASGIYGDYLFAEADRFGIPADETDIRPIFAMAGNLVRDDEDTDNTGEDVTARWLALLQGNTPFVNLLYTRTAMDYLILNNMLEWAMPGQLKRLQSEQMQDKGQPRLWF